MTVQGTSRRIFPVYICLSVMMSKSNKVLTYRDTQQIIEKWCCICRNHGLSRRNIIAQKTRIISPLMPTQHQALGTSARSTVPVRNQRRHVVTLQINCSHKALLCLWTCQSSELNNWPPRTMVERPRMLLAAGCYEIALQNHDRLERTPYRVLCFSPPLSGQGTIALAQYLCSSESYGSAGPTVRQSRVYRGTISEAEGKHFSTLAHNPDSLPYVWAWNIVSQNHCAISSRRNFWESLL